MIRRETKISLAILINNNHTKQRNESELKENKCVQVIRHGKAWFDAAVQCPPHTHLPFKK